MTEVLILLLREQLNLEQSILLVDLIMVLKCNVIVLRQSHMQLVEVEKHQGMTMRKANRKFSDLTCNGC